MECAQLKPITIDKWGNHFINGSISSYSNHQNNRKVFPGCYRLYLLHFIFPGFPRFFLLGAAIHELGDLQPTTRIMETIQ